MSQPERLTALSYRQKRRRTKRVVSIGENPPQLFNRKPTLESTRPSDWTRVICFFYTHSNSNLSLWCCMKFLCH